MKAIYGSVDAVDAFTEMISEPQVAGSEFGRTLGEVIAASTDIAVADLPSSVFLLDADGARTDGRSGDRRQDSDQGRGGDNRQEPQS